MHIVSRREELESALAKAEAALAQAVIDSARADADPVEANANLDNTRAYCRQVRAALAELNRSESTAWPGAWIDALIRQFEELSKRGVTASPPSRSSDERAVLSDNKGSRDASRQRIAVRRFNMGFSAQDRGPGDAPARRPLLWQIIGLLAVLLACLVYLLH